MARAHPLTERSLYGYPDVHELPVLALPPTPHLGRLMDELGRLRIRILIILAIGLLLIAASGMYAIWAAQRCEARGGVFTGHGLCVAPGTLR